MRHSVCILLTHYHKGRGYSYPILELRKLRLDDTSQVTPHILWQHCISDPVSLLMHAICTHSTILYSVIRVDHLL